MVRLSPSLMCCDMLDIKRQIKIFERQDIDYLHIDIMDGSFVPNFTLGADFVNQIKKATDIPIDLHLMINEPEKHLNTFALGEGDMVSIHYESTNHLQKVLRSFKDKGTKALLAFNPATPIELAIDVIDDIDGMLVMTVNPGFSGQKIIPHSDKKVLRASKFLKDHKKHDYALEVDGNINIPNAIMLKEAGANIFVLGTSAIFNSYPLEDNIISFRRSIN